MFSAEKKFLYDAAVALATVVAWTVTWDEINQYSWIIIDFVW